MSAVPAVLFLVLAASFTFAAGYEFGVLWLRNNLGLSTRPLRWYQCENAMLAATVALCCWTLAAYSLAKWWPA